MATKKMKRITRRNDGWVAASCEAFCQIISPESGHYNRLALKLSERSYASEGSLKQCQDSTPRTSPETFSHYSSHQPRLSEVLPTCAETKLDIPMCCVISAALLYSQTRLQDTNDTLPLLARTAALSYARIDAKGSNPVVSPMKG
jgi:hypothetical protein